MADLSRKEMRKVVSAILKGADLSTLSSKKVRMQLEKKYDADLTHRKQEIDNIVMDMVEELTEQASDEDHVSPAAKTKSRDEEEEVDRNGDASSNSEVSSDSESDFEAPQDMGPPQKKIKTAKKPKSFSPTHTSPKGTDAEIAKKLQAMENEDGRRSTRSGRAPTSNSKKKAKEPKPKNSNKPKSTKGYGQLCTLSPALSDVLGVKEMARSDVVKKMWEIIRERELADPRNKQFMICDEELQKIFKRKRVRTFGMMKYLKDHIFNPGELEDMLA